jgi:hypothetical protein
MLNLSEALERMDTQRVLIMDVTSTGGACGHWSTVDNHRGRSGRLLPPDPTADAGLGSLLHRPGLLGQPDPGNDPLRVRFRPYPFVINNPDEVPNAAEPTRLAVGV